jgi:3-phenylpropionate/trans-cinnamate dioxygenase ferredoxin reductase subunit
VRSFEFNDDGTIAAVNCADGSSTPADLFVVGVGLVPNTDVAEAAGLAVDNGIVVDEHARTSDAHIVAAGDCTNHPSLYGRRVRLESVQNAVEQARTAAATLAGRQHSYHAIPWFWSDQYDLKLQMAGLSQGYDQFVLRGLPAQRSFAMFYLKDDRLLACDAVNRPQEFMASKRLIAARSVVDPAALADDSASLRSAVGLRC